MVVEHRGSVDRVPGWPETSATKAPSRPVLRSQHRNRTYSLLGRTKGLAAFFRRNVDVKWQSYTQEYVTNIRPEVEVSSSSSPHQGQQRLFVPRANIVKWYLADPLSHHAVIPKAR